MIQTEEWKAKNLKAVEFLIFEYEAILAGYSLPIYRDFRPECCPLCEVNRDTFDDDDCSSCPWVQYEHKTCSVDEYFSGIVKFYRPSLILASLDRLKRWKEELQPCSPS